MFLIGRGGYLLTVSFLKHKIKFVQPYEKFQGGWFITFVFKNRLAEVEFSYLTVLVIIVDNIITQFVLQRNDSSWFCARSGIDLYPWEFNCYFCPVLAYNESASSLTYFIFVFPLDLYHSDEIGEVDVLRTFWLSSCIPYDIVCIHPVIYCNQWVNQMLFFWL